MAPPGCTLERRFDATSGRWCRMLHCDVEDATPAIAFGRPLPPASIDADDSEVAAARE